MTHLLLHCDAFTKESVKKNITACFSPIQFSMCQMLFIAKNKSSLEMLIRTRLGRFKEIDLMGALNQLTADRHSMCLYRK